jgi:hypothetical protein
VAGDSALAEGIKVVARTHQSMIWDRQRHVLRLRSALREFFPAALDAFATAESLESRGDLSLTSGFLANKKLIKPSAIQISIISPFSADHGSNHLTSALRQF